MRRRLVLLSVAAAILLAGVPARADDAVVCHLAGNAPAWAVRKIVIPWDTEIRFHIKRAWQDSSGVNNQLNVGNDHNYHLFTGFWLLRASDFLRVSSAFFDHSADLAPGGVAISYQGLQSIGQDTPSTNLLTDLDNGAWGYVTALGAGTYYFVGFGDGDGTFDMDATYYGIPGEMPTCEEVPGVTGRIVGYNALDFKGGTQVVGPGYGYAKDAKLSFTNPYPWAIGAAFALEPDPFPPPVLRWDNEGGYHEGISNDMRSILNTSREWTFTTSYTGKTNTILVELLETNLTPDG